jgi:hypothetical protein
MSDPLEYWNNGILELWENNIPIMLRKSCGIEALFPMAQSLLFLERFY